MKTFPHISALKRFYKLHPYLWDYVTIVTESCHNEWQGKSTGLLFGKKELFVRCNGLVYTTLCYQSTTWIPWNTWKFKLFNFQINTFRMIHRHNPIILQINIASQYWIENNILFSTFQSNIVIQRSFLLFASHKHTQIIIAHHPYLSNIGIFTSFHTENQIHIMLLLLPAYSTPQPPQNIIVIRSRVHIQTAYTIQ